ncbi:MAG: prephenate dehydrogenase [Chloroflexi bacterium]|nr:prephenate dehydrogenase [Chloroflexota bacterium]
MELSEARVAVVGLGLMGGSLAAALCARNACREVIGIARRQSSLHTALTLRFIHRGETDLCAGMADADIVVLCTPVGDILQKLGEIGPWLKPGALVLDVGSTKAAICAAMADLPAGIQPVGGHPMCGKESSGLTMAEPGLYQDRAFVLCPLDRTAVEARSLAETLVRAVGARPTYLEPARHDRLVAAISHLPFMLATSLVLAAERVGADDPILWSLAAGGFRDTSRVAAGSVPMMMDILATNRGPILDVLRLAQTELAELAESLQADDAAQLRQRLEAAAERRRRI